MYVRLQLLLLKLVFGDVMNLCATYIMCVVCVCGVCVCVCGKFIVILV